MLNIFLFCINILLLTVITAANTKYQISIKDHIMPMEELPGYLKELLDSLDYLNLHLKHKDDIYENIVLESIISKSACPLQLSVGSNWQLLSAQRHRAITLYPHELQEVLMRYVIKSGIFLCIFLSEPNNEEIVKAASNIWSISGWHKIYYISNEKSVFYNPFHLNENGQYGSLLNMAEHKIEEIFLNMNQYPLRTYIFDSVYSTMFGDANTEQVTEIHGADAKCAQLLRDYMNFTMNLQWPDDTFFGYIYELYIKI